VGQTFHKPIRLVSSNLVQPGPHGSREYRIPLGTKTGFREKEGT
jgi:hypothetical protein